MCSRTKSGVKSRRVLGENLEMNKMDDIHHISKKIRNDILKKRATRKGAFTERI